MSETIKEVIKERYDGFARGVATGQDPQPGLARCYFWSRKIDTALQLGSFPTGAQLLEIGCNMGQLTFPLGHRGYRVAGVDLSVEAIAVAKKKAAATGTDNVSFEVADAEYLSQFPDNHFDGLLSFSTLRYVPDLPKALAAIRRVLKPGALAVVDFPNRFCPWFYVKQWLGSERHPYDHWFTRAELHGIFKEAGFSDCSPKPILFTPTIAPDRLLGLFKAVDWVGERTPYLRDLAGIIMVAARKR